MNNLSEMMSDELISLQADIKRELCKRESEKRIPVFGVYTSPLHQYEFSTPDEAITCVRELLDDVLTTIKNDLAMPDGLGGWKGDLIRVYVNQVKESDYALLKPYLGDK